MADPAPAARPQPTRLYRWLVLVFISLAMFGNYYVYDCIGPLAPLLSKQGFSDSSIGLLQAIYSFPNIVMVLIGGIIIDRIGTKKSTLLFGVICFIGAVVTAWPETPALAPLGVGVNALLKVFGWVFDVSSVPPVVAVMAAGRLLFGLGAESLIVAVTTAIARWFKGKELSLAFGAQPDDLAARVARRAGVAELGRRSPTRPGRARCSCRSAFGAFCIIGAALYWMLESYAVAALRARRGGQDRQGGLPRHLGIRQVLLVHRRCCASRSTRASSRSRRSRRSTSSTRAARQPGAGVVAGRACSRSSR